MSADAFHDAIAEYVGHTSADDVLDMREMREIKAFIGWFAHRHQGVDGMRALLQRETSLTHNVIEWVLS